MRTLTIIAGVLIALCIGVAVGVLVVAAAAGVR